MTSHTFDDVTAITVMFFLIKIPFPRQFTGVLGKKAPAQIGNLFKQYTLLFTTVTYINSWNVVFTDNLSVNKQFLEFDKSLDYMVNVLFVSML